jgi:serine protease Do
VLLKIKKKGIAAVEIEKDRVPSVGSWLVTVQQKELPLSIGIMSHAARKFENIASNSAVIGIFPENRLEGDGVRINRVEIDSPAEAAGLLINDVIVAIDKDPILNREQLLGKLSNFEPGDEIILEVKRGEELMEVPITLGRRRVNPMMESGNRQNRMGSTLSKRRSDFPLAIQHDATLNANECGGPIVDSSGKVVGVNIARDGRVSTLALPNQIVAAVIRKLKTGKFTPEVVNKTEIARVEKELAKLDNELGTLPKEKMEADLQFHAGVAVEEELQLQLKEAEERLKQLQERLAEKKKSNRQLSDALAELQSKQNRIERKKEPLKQELRRLATGIQ